ncbi:hypothetical protein AK812_SmicGene11435 [Symbiodinium microadriaticum]|uniref:Uncharacterized protein n=1 Tax=Symbiodinium microadriaticum TaxID=2951 RepID=A0A1Q9ED73_SYMMI|nr:hypothetical protein AK812_SmicGene11435 [Symbiodinium microadriaticum]CAE7679227.1 unnamed protein product [Symbiodinium microadriaticum]
MHVTRCGRQPALVFYDVRAAYYQVLRECLTGADLDDRVLLQLFSKLGVPSHAFSELQAQLSRLATLADSGCTPHTVALLEEVFVGTWFRMDQHVPLVATSAGVRPGDPLADVLFAVSFSAYAKAVQEALSAAGLATTLPASAAAPPWGPREPVPLGPASWADDFAAMHAADDHLALLALVREATSLYLTHATANGIQLAFATDKTAAVLPPKACYDPSVARGPTSGELFLPIVDGITGRTHHLPVVQAYKHLGGVVTSGLDFASPQRHEAVFCNGLCDMVSVLLGNSFGFNGPSATTTPGGSVKSEQRLGSAYGIWRLLLMTPTLMQHGLVAPARLYAPQPFCIACLRHFHTLPRAQAHLKSSKKCLLRASHLMPPLTITQVKEAEAEDKLLTRKLKHGNWQLFSAAPPILPVYGPVQPTREELRNFLGDEAPLSLLQDPPADLDLVTWVRREAGFTTVEPVRVKAVSFWHKRIGAACNRV